MISILNEASRKSRGAAGVTERSFLSDVILLKMSRGAQGDVNRNRVSYSSRPLLSAADV